MKLITDQRNAPRYLVCVPAKIICSDKETILGQVTNLSESGFLCTLKIPLAPDTLVSFVLLFPPTCTGETSGSQSFRGEGVVVREIDSGEDPSLSSHPEFPLCVRFTTMDAESRSRLERFIRECKAS